jgi:hypothetical protein
MSGAVWERSKHSSSRSSSTKIISANEEKANISFLSKSRKFTFLKLNSLGKYFSLLSFN